MTDVFVPVRQNEGQLKCIASSDWNTSLYSKYLKISLCSFKKWMHWKIFKKKNCHYSKLKVAKNTKKIKGLSQKRQSK